MNTSTTAGSHNLLRCAYQWARAKSRDLGGEPQGFPADKGNPALLFLREFCKKPRTVGAVWPSSRRLAKSMAQCVHSDDGIIVELGAGTGRVTRALAESVQDPRRVWAVEQSPKLARHLAATLPHINVVQGDACQLASLVPSSSPVDVIISCLPLRSMPAEVVSAITSQWAKVLAPGGTVVQFTYALWNGHVLEKQGFYESEHSVVWRNFPPARVQVLKKIQH